MSEPNCVSTTELPFGIMDVVHLLHLKIRRTSGDNVYLDCPFCGDQRGRMNVSLRKDLWHCYHCKEGSNAVMLLGKLRHYTYWVAFYEICEALIEGNLPQVATPSISIMPALRPSGEAPLCTAPIVAELDKPVVLRPEIAGPKEIHHTLSTLLTLLPLRNLHRKALYERGLTDAEIDKVGYKSTPPPYLCPSIVKRLIELGCTVRGVPGFYINENGHWTMRFGQRTAGFIIPAVSEHGLIRGYQLRLDVPIRDADDDPKKDGTKYLWFSSEGKYMGITSGSPVHFAGDPCVDTVFVTEGLLKADIAHCLTGRSFVAIAGANNTLALDSVFAWLNAHNTKRIIEALDMDKFRNEAVLKGAAKMKTLAEKNELDFQSIMWNPNYKGIDDWQYALKNQTAIRTSPSSFKAKFLYGACDAGAVGVFTAEWGKSAKTLPLPDYLGLLPGEYDVYCREGELGLARILLPQRKTVNYRIYQLVLGAVVHTLPFAFADLEAVHKAGYLQPPATNYLLACDDNICCPSELTGETVIELLRTRYGNTLPPGYQGRSLAPSDVVELYGPDGRRYYYCNKDGVATVHFSPLLAQQVRRYA